MDETDQALGIWTVDEDQPILGEDDDLPNLGEEGDFRYENTRLLVSHTISLWSELWDFLT
jgi:hypothetical protein